VRLVDAEVGARIRRLRLAAGLKAQDLADRIGIDPTALSKLENGKRSLKTPEFARLAEALRVSPLALLEDDPLLAELPIAARRAGSSISTGGAYDRLLSLTELHVLLKDAGIATSPNLSAVPSVHNLGWLEAAKVLADWATTTLGPVPVIGDQRLAALASAIETSLNVDVLIDAFPGDALSGAAITDRSFPLLFVNSDHSRPRSLFTLAHELGHLLAGHAEEGISLDRELAGTTDDERMANAFAVRYLLPEFEIVESLDMNGRRLSTLIRLADDTGVSYETLIYRLHNLRLIDADGRDRLLSMSWQRLVTQCTPSLLALGKSRTELGRLLARSQQKPAGRPPALLLRRASEGFQKGVISVRPLAGLIKEDPARLLEQLTDDADPQSISAQFAQDPQLSNAELETDEELFSGSPI
jgi:Zn-dependent peptidase ImmA (M78 family)/transcriptional regulator with XRE-family HTH domain